MTTFTAPQSVPTHTVAVRPPLAINGALAAVVALAIIVTLVLSGGDVAADSPSGEGVNTTSDLIEIYVVQPGDTLWAIALERAHDASCSSSLNVARVNKVDCACFASIRQLRTWRPSCEGNTASNRPIIAPRSASEVCAAGSPMSHSCSI